MEDLGESEAGLRTQEGGGGGEGGRRGGHAVQKLEAGPVLPRVEGHHGKVVEEEGTPPPILPYQAPQMGPKLVNVPILALRQTKDGPVHLHPPPPHTHLPQHLQTGLIVTFAVRLKIGLH